MEKYAAGATLAEVVQGVLDRQTHCEVGPPLVKAIREAIGAELERGNEAVFREALWLCVSDLDYAVSELAPTVREGLLDFIEHRLAQHNLSLVVMMCQSEQGSNLYQNLHTQYLRKVGTSLLLQVEKIKVELERRAISEERSEI